MEHIIHTMKIPSDMRKKFELAAMIKSFINKAQPTPYEKIVNENYADALNKLAWAEFQHKGLKLPYGEKMSFSHTIDADLLADTLTFKRVGTAEPTIYEKLNLSINLKTL